VPPCASAAQHAPEPRALVSIYIAIGVISASTIVGSLRYRWTHEEVRDEDAKMLVLPGVPGIVEPRTVKDFGGKGPDCMSLAGRIDTAPTGAVEFCGGVTTL
jgi:hypothetical protein